MLTELLNRPYAPQCPNLFPDISERQVWGTLSCSERWLRAGSEVLHNQNALPELPLSLWLDFTKTGNRNRYEAPYFVRRRTLCALTMAELISGTGSCLPAVADACWTICEESAWQVPAHNLYVRDTPQLSLPDQKRSIVDLFGAETGALIATVYGLLGKKLDAYAPGLRTRLKREVEQRILQPYCTEHFWWMGGKGEQCNNWTPWCTQNVLIAAAQLVPAADLPTYIEKAAASLDCFLDEYGEDGCCSEGAQYYRHAALTLSLIHILVFKVEGLGDPPDGNTEHFAVQLEGSGEHPHQRQQGDDRDEEQDQINADLHKAVLFGLFHRKVSFRYIKSLNFFSALNWNRVMEPTISSRMMAAAEALP